MPTLQPRRPPDAFKQLETLLENSELKTADPTNRVWMSSLEKQVYDDDQMGYTKVYQAEYHDFKGLSKVYNRNEFTEEEYQKRQEELANHVNVIPKLGEFKRSRRGKLPHLYGGVNERTIHDLEGVSTIKPPTEPTAEIDFTSNVNVDDLKKRYFSNYKRNTTLPIYSSRTNIINSIQSYTVVIIQGQTGCGKTTQVPAYILEDALLDRNQSKAPVSTLR